MTSNDSPIGNQKAKEHEKGRVNKQKLIAKEDSLTGNPSTSYPTFQEHVCFVD